MQLYVLVPVDSSRRIEEESRFLAVDVGETDSSSPGWVQSVQLPR